MYLGLVDTQSAEALGRFVASGELPPPLPELSEAPALPADDNVEAADFTQLPSLQRSEFGDLSLPALLQAIGLQLAARLGALSGPVAERVGQQVSATGRCSVGSGP
jgi:hypothetical protein